MKSATVRVAIGPASRQVQIPHELAVLQSRQLFQRKGTDVQHEEKGRGGTVPSFSKRSLCLWARFVHTRREAGDSAPHVASLLQLRAVRLATEGRHQIERGETG